MTNSVTITDNRTGQTVEIPVEGGGIDMAAIQKLMPGTWVLDPAFTGTASTTSTITDLDGANGILRYRGYPIEQLAENSTFLEVSYLLLHGELPTQLKLDAWVQDVRHHTFIHENMRKRFTEGFHYDAHPMGMLMSAIAGLSTYYPEAKDVLDADTRHRQIVRLIAKTPTLAALAYRSSVGMPFVYPDNDLSYPENFLSMMWRIAEPQYRPDPVLTKALDVLFILHADHEQNCSTSTVRLVGSSRANLFAAVSAGILALWGPLHGGANQEVLEMLEEIARDGGDVQKFVLKAKDPNDPFRLMGFGHRVYKNYDPRATIIKRTADTVLAKLGKEDEPLLKIAKQLEEAARSDSYFVERKLYPNVDFYSGIIYHAMGIPTNMFTVMFAIGRLPGWIAQWKEMLEQKAKIGRPRQIYVGPTKTDYVPIDARD